MKIADENEGSRANCRFGSFNSTYRDDSVGSWCKCRSWRERILSTHFRRTFRWMFAVEASRPCQKLFQGCSQTVDATPDNGCTDGYIPMGHVHCVTMIVWILSFVTVAVDQILTLATKSIDTLLFSTEAFFSFSFFIRFYTFRSDSVKFL